MDKEKKKKIVNAIDALIERMEQIHGWTGDQKLLDHEKDPMIIKISETVNKAFLEVKRFRQTEINEKECGKIIFRLDRSDLRNGSKISKLETIQGADGGYVIRRGDKG